jgi:hydroxypyruvate isomerase
LFQNELDTRRTLVVQPIRMNMSRRELIATGGAAGLGLVVPSSSESSQRVVQKGRLKQSVSRWCYESIAMPEFCRAVSAMGLTAIDLLEEQDWAVVRDYGLICSMGYGGGGTIESGLNAKTNHDTIVKNLEKSLPRAKELGVPNVITFFGSRRGMSDQEGTDICVAALERIKPIAESTGVMVCVELLNSKVDHPDYQGDHTPFGVAVVKAINSPKVKLLYDIYHMQIMEGDLIRTIRDNHQYIAHYHTGGVPGRHELDQTQEVNWPTVCAAIADTGFTGYVAHEFNPTRDPLTSLRQAVKDCDV